MKGIIDIGTSWSALTCISIDLAERRRDYPDTTMFDITNETQYTFKCRCGAQFKVWANEWKGKRATKDCGCGAGDNDDVKTTMSFYLSYALIVLARSSARNENVSFNEWVNRAMRERLERRGELA